MSDVDLKTAVEETAAEDTNSTAASAETPAAEKQAIGEPPAAAEAVESQEPAADQPPAEEEAAIEQQAVAAEEQAAAESEASAEALAAPEEHPAESPQPEPAPEIDEVRLKAMIEAIVYVAEEPATAAQLTNALEAPAAVVQRVLDDLVAEYGAAAHGVMIREVAGGYKMATKAEHHEAVRAFAKSLKPPLKLSLAALETLATIAYKQPITAPEIMEIRGVQGAGVLKTLLDRRLIQAGGRKNVVGRPILYRTSKEFLMQFGLKDLAELPTLKEFEELRRLAIGEDEGLSEESTPAPESGAPETLVSSTNEFVGQTSESPASEPAPAAGGSGEPATSAASTAGETEVPAEGESAEPATPAAEPGAAASTAGDAAAPSAEGESAETEAPASGKDA